MKKLTCLFACMSLALLSNVTLSAQNQLLNMIRYEANIDEICNAINNAEWSDANLAVVHSLWGKDLGKCAEVPRSEADNDIIRLALANVLMQATRHCRIDGISMDELHQFVLSRTESNNASIRGRATYLLGLAGHDSDIPFLVSVVEAEEEGFAEEAALSITFIHTEAALDALQNLAKKVSRPSLRSFLQELVEKYEAYPIGHQSKECINNFDM